MPVVQVATAPSRAHYEKVREFVDLAADRPHGLIHHSAAELPGGEIQIVDVYESRADYDAFGERIFKAFAQAGVLEMVQAQGRPVAYETIDCV